MVAKAQELSSRPIRGDQSPLPTLRFDAPRPPRKHVQRTRLLNVLTEAANQPLTLVSAPAGSGKTTLLAAWVAERMPEETVAWLTHEAGDDRSDRFWSLLIESLNRSGLGVGGNLAAESPAPLHGLLTELSATLSALDNPLTLVLDGFEITDLALAGELDFVLMHSGRRLRLVILTRADPVMPLHRFRLEGTMTELRMSDLAFSKDETAQLVEQFGVDPGSRAVTLLTDRIKGWAAGLRYACILLASSEDPVSTVGRLTGDSGNIAEYLMAEILQTQPKQTRSLLLRTSVVDVLQPGLIEELAGRSGGRELVALSHANVLVEELPGHPGWFRYHPLLRDLLRAESAYAAPRRHRRLQRRAARWFSSQGHVSEAVALSTAAADWSTAASYAVHGLAVGKLVMGADTHGLVRALREMPGDTTGAAACVVRAALALSDNDPNRCAAELSDARASGDAADSPLDTAVQLAIDVVETVRCRRVDDVVAVQHADRASSQLETHTGAGTVTHGELVMLIQANKGVAQLRSGQLASADEALRRATHAAPAQASSALLVSVGAHLAISACLQDQLRQARDWACRSIALADEDGMATVERPPEAEVALGWVSTERCELSAAEQHLEASRGSRTADPFAGALWTLVRARSLLTRGHADQAIQLIDRMKGRLRDHGAWLHDLLVLEEAKARIAQGDPELAVRLMNDTPLSDRGAAALVLGQAHLQLADYKAVAESVASVGTPDADNSPSTAVGGALLEAALELHFAHEREARAAFLRALRLAAPDCLRRPFCDASRPVRDLLTVDTELLSRSRWLGVAALPRPAARPPDLLSTGSTRPRVLPAKPPKPNNVVSTLASGQIIEPLTPKEQEVLDHLSELLTTEEIAAAMFVSVNTVRTHVRNILRKLAVSHRNQAVRRARALSLIRA